MTMADMIRELSDFKKCKGHTCVVWNIRSLLPKIEELERFKILGSPEFIGITKSWLTNKVDDMQVALAGYNMLRSERNANSGKNIQMRISIVL